MGKIEITTRRAVSMELQKFDHLAKPDSFIEVTEWTNGEGYDITINERVMSFTHGELRAIHLLTEFLDLEIETP